ncbi:MAG: hydrogenase maturation protease [Dehalococcoidia bacterium]
MDGKTKTLILGLGNSLLCDDGVGIYVAAELKNRVDRPEITVTETGVAGLSLLDLLAGYDKAIIIDAIKTTGGKAGQIYRLDPKSFDTALHTASAHGIDFPTALEFGRKLGLHLPQQIVIFAVEASDIRTFSEECTPEVRKAIPTCVEMVLQELKRG